MSNSIEIKVERSIDQKSITVTDVTEWVGDTIDSLVDIKLSFYINNGNTAFAEYEFTAGEEAEYTGSGEITLVFEDILPAVVTTDGFIPDNWYIVKMTADTETYVSNYEGFGVYTFIKNKVYDQVNGLRTPEQYRGNIEEIYQSFMFMKGLEYLDTSNILSKEIKFKKRLSALTKMLA